MNTTINHWPDAAIGAFVNRRNDNRIVFVIDRHKVENPAGETFAGTMIDGSGYCLGADRWQWIERPAAEWDGQGLPPAGTVCEVLNNTLDRPEWERCTILFTGKFKAIYESESCHERVADVSENWMISFRPLRTPEQIAAEQRKKAIDAMLTDIESTVGDWNHSIDAGAAMCAVVAALHDAGYRK